MSGSYTAILGLSPSRAARSPALWNAVFEAEGIDCRFHPMDVEEADLARLVAALRADPRFLGGSVAVPHKSAIVPLLDRVEPAAARIGAVNVVYRDGATLVGANTDGAGALSCLLDSLRAQSLGGRKVALMGVGGAGRAVAAYVAESLGDTGELVLCNRTRGTAEALATALPGRISVDGLAPADATLAGAAVLINCTTLGYMPPAGSGQAQPGGLLTPLGPTTDPVANFAGSLAALGKLSAGALVYDIIYQPVESMLLIQARSLGLPVLNGLCMNLEQAVIAFLRVFPDRVGPERVRAVMGGVA